MALILMILVGRLLKWMWSHEDDMLLPHYDTPVFQTDGVRFSSKEEQAMRA